MKLKLTKCYRPRDDLEIPENHRIKDDIMLDLQRIIVLYLPSLLLAATVEPGENREHTAKNVAKVAYLLPPENK